MGWINWGVWMLAGATAVAHAGDIYVCEKNGKKEFSQLPCGENATVIKDKNEPSSIKITIPMTDKDIVRLCQLVIQSKDKYAVAAPPVPTYSRRNYRYDNYRYDNYRYNTTRNNNSNTPQAYFLSHITNLEQLAGQTPRLYEMLKRLPDNVSYQGYDQSPVYQAERAAAQTNCEDDVARNLGYIYDQ